jgi:hypothetical protein
MELVGVDRLPAEEASLRLSSFLSEKSQCTSFPQLKAADGKAAWQSLFSLLGQAAMADSHKAALSCCRILSRDKAHLSECVTVEQVGQLMQLSGLASPDGRPVEDPAARLEAKKVLSNLVHQSTVLQTYAIQRGIVPAALRLVSEHRCSAPGGDDPESRRFDFRLLFLVTALCPDQRTIARSQHSALGRQPNTSVGKERPYLYSVTAPDLFVCHLKIRGENPT